MDVYRFCAEGKWNPGNAVFNHGLMFWHCVFSFQMWCQISLPAYVAKDFARACVFAAVCRRNSEHHKKKACLTAQNECGGWSEIAPHPICRSKERFAIRCDRDYSERGNTGELDCQSMLRPKKKIDRNGRSAVWCKITLSINQNFGSLFNISKLCS